MLSAFISACLLLGVIAPMSAPVIGKAPPESKKDVPTAFPNLRPPTDRKKWPEPLFKKFPLTIPADASPLRRVRLLQANEGAAYLKGALEGVKIHGWNQWYRNSSIMIARDLFRAAAAEALTDGARIACYEDHVIVLKAIEEDIPGFVKSEVEPARVMQHAHFYRLQAEIDLLRLKCANGQPTTAEMTGLRTSLSSQSAPRSSKDKDLPFFTAFPELKAPEINEAMPGFLFDGFPLTIPADASPLLKVQLREANAGSAYLRIMFELVVIWKFGVRWHSEFMAIASNLYRTAAETELNSAARIPWYADRVIVLKTYEELARRDVKTGDLPPEDLHLARCYRLGAEADLLKLQEEIEKTGPRIQVAGSLRPFIGPAFPEAGSRFYVETPTAFPGLRPPGKDFEYGEAIVRRVDFTKLSANVSKSFSFVIPEGASPLCKVQLNQANEGAAYLKNVFERIGKDVWLPWWNNESVLMIADLYQAAGDRETTPAARVRWHEERIIMLKAFEGFIRQRQDLLSEPPLPVHLVHFHRLAAEAELLKLNDSLAAASSPAPIIVCPQPIPRCRPRLFPRRWR